MLKEVSNAIYEDENNNNNNDNNNNKNNNNNNINNNNNNNNNNININNDNSNNYTNNNNNSFINNNNNNNNSKTVIKLFDFHGELMDIIENGATKYNITNVSDPAQPTLPGMLKSFEIFYNS